MIFYFIKHVDTEYKKFSAKKRRSLYFRKLRQSL